MRAIAIVRLVAVAVLLLGGFSAWATSVVPRASAQAGLTLTIPAAPNLVDGQTYTWSVSGAAPGSGSNGVVLSGFFGQNCGSPAISTGATIEPGQDGGGQSSFTHAQQYGSYRAVQVETDGSPSNCVNVTTVPPSPNPSPSPAAPSPSPAAPLTLTINGSTGPVQLVPGQTYPATVTVPPGGTRFLDFYGDAACQVGLGIAAFLYDTDGDGTATGAFGYQSNQRSFQVSSDGSASNCVAAIPVESSLSPSPSPSPVVQSPSPVAACPSVAQPAGARPPRSPRPGASVTCAATPESPRPDRSPRPAR